MCANVRVDLGLSVEELKECIISVGGFGFVVKCPNSGEEVQLPFDFEAACVQVKEDGTITYQSGSGLLFNAEYLDAETYRETYAELGIGCEEITAELLAGACTISEFYFDIEDVANETMYYGDGLKGFEIISISFSDGTATFDVSADVVEKYNATFREVALSGGLN